MNKSVGHSTVSEPKATMNYSDYGSVKQRGIDPCHSPYSRGIGVARGGKKAAMQGNPSYRKVD